MGKVANPKGTEPCDILGCVALAAPGKKLCVVHERWGWSLFTKRKSEQGKETKSGERDSER